MDDSVVRVSYIVFPLEKEDGTLGYAAACVASTGDSVHPIGMMRFESLSLLEEFGARVVQFCQKEKIRGVPSEILDSFKEEDKNGEQGMPI